MTASCSTSTSASAVLEHLSTLWRYGIRLEEIDATTDKRAQDPRGRQAALTRRREV